jgi:hypothetical protein
MPSDELEQQGAAAADEPGAAAAACGRWEWASNAHECRCPVVQGRVYHNQMTCTDPQAIRLGWFGTPPQIDATGGPRPTNAGGLL